MLTNGGLNPGDIIFHTEWAAGNTVLLSKILEDDPDIKFVVIDTLARFRPRAKSNSDIYGKDYEDLALIKQVADKHEVSVLVLHHLRKAKSEDPFEMINGTGGINGAADTLWVLDRNPSAPTASLHIRGRDVEDQMLSLQFENCHWRNIGGFEAKPSIVELNYINYLKQKPMSPKDLAEATGEVVANVSKRLQRMLAKGMVTKVEHGLYTTFDNLL